MASVAAGVTRYPFRCLLSAASRKKAAISCTGIQRLNRTSTIGRQQGICGSCPCVQQEAPEGNSTQDLSYSYVDVQPVTSDNFHRLIQVEKDSKQTVSQMLRIRFDVSKSARGLAVFPNPADAAISIAIAAPAAQTIIITVADITGRIVARQQVEAQKGSNLFHLDIAGFEQGIYLLRTSGEDVETGSVKFRKKR